MNEKTFQNYQQRMLDAMRTPNRQSNNPFTELANILDNLRNFVESNTFSQSTFRKEVDRQFACTKSSDETAIHFRNQLKQFCSTKSEALKSISDLYDMVNPLSRQVSSWSSVASIANECMAEIEKSIYNPK